MLRSPGPSSQIPLMDYIVGWESLRLKPAIWKACTLLFAIGVSRMIHCDGIMRFALRWARRNERRSSPCYIQVGGYGTSPATQQWAACLSSPEAKSPPLLKSSRSSLVSMTRSHLSSREKTSHMMTIAETAVVHHGCFDENKRRSPSQ